VTAALTFSPGQVLAVAIIALLLVIVAIWGIFEGEADAARRHHDRQAAREARHAKEGIEQ